MDSPLATALAVLTAGLLIAAGVGLTVVMLFP